MPGARSSQRTGVPPAPTRSCRPATNSTRCRRRQHQAWADAQTVSSSQVGDKEGKGDNGPNAAGGRMTYKPESFGVIVKDAARAVMRGSEAEQPCMEVEFPAVSGSDSYKVSSDIYIDSNTQLAIQAGREIHRACGKKVVVLLPDGGELARSAKLFKSTMEMAEGVTLSHLWEGREPLRQGLQRLFGMDATAAAPVAAADADVHLVINISTSELPDVQKYLQQVVKDGASLCFWNCELDTLRGDLGLVGFPPKATHHDFLSRCKSVFYLRQRNYSKTVNIAPYIINYSGCLFREFPGPWQVMLRQDTGEYACVAEDASRYTLGEVKAELMEAMGLNTEAEGSRMQFLRRGYKTTTWWEDDEELEKSDAWRT